MKKLTKFLRSPRKAKLLLGVTRAVIKGGFKAGITFIRNLDNIKKGLPAHDESRPVFVADYFLDGDIPEFHLNNCIDIIIPIYNGYDYLEPLFASIFSNTTTSHRIIVINDCSPDNRVSDFLNHLEQYKNTNCKELIAVNNEVNLGFVQTINSAQVYLENNFVILNTDVEVPYGWLERLMAPIERLSNIASTTPFTNAGTICSFPVWLEDNKLPFELTLQQIDEEFRRVNFEKTYISIPTGVGFCMGMNKSLVDQVGLFDADNFGKGYCEENDWCQRAIKAGYENIHVTNLFVYHKHGGSFGDSKAQLIKENYKKLLTKHPKYEKSVWTCIEQNKLSDLRAIMTLRIAIGFSDIALVFDHGFGGGATKYMEENIYPNHQAILLITGFYESPNVLVRVIENSQEKCRVKFTSLEYLYENILKTTKFVHSYINHSLTFNSLKFIQKIISENSIDSSYYLHDFLAICPSYTLINNDGVYCGTCEDLSICNNCQKENTLHRRNELQYSSMDKWRKEYSELLSLVNRIYCFSHDSYNHLTKIYPLVANKVVIRPHKIKFDLRVIKYKIDFSQNNTITIGVLGGINYQKGRAVLEEMVEFELFKSSVFDLVIVGHADVLHIKNCKITGKYDQNRLTEIVQKSNVDLFLLPSIWPETFCYTAEEIMSLGLPLICFNIGAPPERVIKYTHGFICDEISSDSLYQKIIEVVEKYNFKTS